MGEAEPARDCARRAVAAADETDSPLVRGTAALDRARALHALGETAEAAREARTAREHFAAKGHRPGADRASAFAEETTATARDGKRPDAREGRSR